MNVTFFGIDGFAGLLAFWANSGSDGEVHTLVVFAGYDQTSAMRHLPWSV